MKFTYFTDGAVSNNIKRAGLKEVDTIIHILSVARDHQIEQGLPSSWRMIPQPAVVASVRRGETKVIQLAGKTVGTFSLEWQDSDVWPDSTMASASYLHRLAIFPGYQGQGIGTVAVNWAQQTAAEQGRFLLRLDAVATNARLCQWYEQLGFTRKGEVLLPGWTRASMRYERALDRRSTWAY